MRQWFVLYSKENLEMLRNFKWLWVPLIFVMLGIMQPLSTYYLPEILETMGGLPEGTVIEIPIPSSGEVIVETFAQFSILGVLILVLATMGTVAGERQSGVAGIIMVKPVPFISYISAKWAGVLTLTVTSSLLGMLGAGYYTEVLFGELDFVRLGQSTIIYCLWLVFVISITLFLSSVMKGTGSIAFISLFTVIILSLLTSLFEWLMGWSPARLPDHASSIMILGETQKNFGIVIAVTLAIIIGLILGASAAFKKKELVQ